MCYCLQTCPCFNSRISRPGARGENWCMPVWAQVVWGRITDWTDSFCEIGLPPYGLLLRARALGSPQQAFHWTSWTSSICMMSLSICPSGFNSSKSLHQGDFRKMFEETSYACCFIFLLKIRIPRWAKMNNKWWRPPLFKSSNFYLFG